MTGFYILLGIMYVLTLLQVKEEDCKRVYYKFLATLFLTMFVYFIRH